MTNHSTPQDAAHEDISAGLSETAGHLTSAEKRARRTSADFRPSAHFERLLEMRRDNPAQFERLGNATAIAAALYESQRAVHATVTGGDAA